MHDSKCRPNSGSSPSFTRLFLASLNLCLQALEDQCLTLLSCLTLLCVLTWGISPQSPELLVRYYCSRKKPWVHFHIQQVNVSGNHQHVHRGGDHPSLTGHDSWLWMESFFSAAHTHARRLKKKKSKIACKQERWETQREWGKDYLLH